MDYLQKKFDLNDPNTVSIFDELSLWSSYFTRLLLDNIDMKPRQQILDVGFGLGVPLFELAHRMGNSCQFTGIDPWAAAVEKARWKHKVYGLKNVKILCQDASEMPFEEEQFDMVISNLGINNFPEPQKVVAECFRVLKKGGKFVLTSNLVGHFHEFYSVFESTLRELKMQALIPKLKQQEAHRGTVESIRELLENQGFVIPKIIKDRFHWRYLNGSAFFRHSLTVLGFLEGWRSVLEGVDEKIVFSIIEEKLNEQAAWDGELKMTVPMLYIEGMK